MHKRRTGKGFLCLLTVLSLLVLSGCARGGATGEKTVQGMAALEAENYQGARELFSDAILEGEPELLACRGLGIAYLGLAQYEEAEEAFAAALTYTDSKMPENTLDLQLYMATAQYRNEKYEETIDTCTEILGDGRTENEDALYLRGASYLHEGAQAEAKEDFDRAVELAPEDYDLYLNIYECYRELNLSGAGGEYLQSALNIQGEDMEHYYNRGRIYYYLENYEEAQVQLGAPVEAEYEPAMYLMGKVYLALEDYAHAQAIYEQAMESFGESVQGYNGLALCAIESGEYETALSYISKGLALGDTSGVQELYFNEIVVYEKMLDFETAREKAREYVQNYPADEAGQKEWVFLSTR